MSKLPLSTRTTSPQGWKKTARFHRRPTGRPYGGQSSWSVLGRLFSRLPRPKNIAKKIVVGIGLLIAIGGVASLALLGWAAKDLPNPNRIIDRSVAQSTKIYDRTGKTLLYDVHGNEKRTLVELSDIPKNVVNATLTAEDRNFYKHGGISFTGIIRSVLKNIFTGSKVGGSTLTQQLVKNAILTSEKTYTRKIKEIILSWQIERRFSKDQILQLYFNEIPYGSVAYGAQAAAQTYLGKNIQDVSLAEAAVLAALPQAPTYYSPYGSHTDALFARQRWILDNMVDLNFITKDQAEAAKKEKIQFNQTRENIKAPHFVMFVREYLTQKYGELAVEQGGLQVTTTLDTVKQELAEKVLKEQAEKNLTWKASNAAMVALDTKTGQIVSMVGSKDFFDETIDGQVNVSTRPRQPGSSFKPIVYTAAFKKGYTPTTVLYDVETTFLNYDGNDYTPHNYDSKEHGPVTMGKALAGSLNIPAVKTIYLTGVDQVIDLAEDLGYTTLKNRSRFGLSLVLGGGEVTLLEHTAAFATLAREGEYHPPVAILEVRDKDGNVLEKYESQEKKVLETEIARQTTSILSDNGARAYIFGEKNFLNLGARPVAAKTGTTNDYKDAWTMGYTPSLAVGVWVGNNDNTPMKRGADGSLVAAPIWHAFMSQILGNTPVEAFQAPAPYTTGKSVLDGNDSSAGGVTVRVNRINGKLATASTPENLVEERTYRQLHSILYYVNKDDPRGDTPPDHNSEQFRRWEAGIATWAIKNHIISQDPPTEFDDGSVTLPPQSLPTLTWVNPQPGQTIALPYTIEADIANTSNVDRIDLSYQGSDGQKTYLNTARQFPNNKLSIQWFGVPTGSYTISADIVDRNGTHSSSSQLTVTIQ